MARPVLCNFEWMIRLDYLFNNLKFIPAPHELKDSVQVKLMVDPIQSSNGGLDHQSVNPSSQGYDCHFIGDVL